MTFDPDSPNAHAETRVPNARRGPATEAERRAAENLPNVVIAGALKGWDATFAASAVRDLERIGASFTEAQWKHVLRIGRIAAPKPAPAPVRSALEQEASEVESQLDAILAATDGDRCVLANDEAGTGRAKSIARALGLGPGGDGPLATTPRLPGYGFALCGSCILSPSRACVKCAAGEPHPGVACEGSEHSRHRNRICKGVALYAHLQSKIVDARGDHATASEIREDMGLVSEKKTSDRA